MTSRLWIVFSSFRGVQRLGLRLREIKTLVEVRDIGQCPCEPAEQLLRNHIAEIDRELARLRSLRGDLVAGRPIAEPRLPGPNTWMWLPKTSSRGVVVDERIALDLPVLRGSAL